jgi:hypothetical protein
MDTFPYVFDVKCDFTRKARFVAGGHWTDTQTQLTYSSVVTQDSVRIAFLIAALNDLEILAADIGNTYLQAPACEKVHTTAGQTLVPIISGKQSSLSALCMDSNLAGQHGTQNLVRP